MVWLAVTGWVVIASGQNDRPATEAAPWDVQAQLKAFDQPIAPPEFKLLWKVEFIGDFRKSQVAFAADGNRLLTYTDKESRVWDAATGRIVGRIRIKPPAKITCGALSADGKVAVVGLDKGGAVVWVSESGERAHEHLAPEAPITAAAISRDGKWVSLADQRNMLHRYPLLGGEGERLQITETIERPPVPVEAISPSGRHWIFASNKDNAWLIAFEQPTNNGGAIDAFTSLHAFTMTDRLVAGIQTNGGVVFTTPRLGARYLNLRCPFPSVAASLTENSEELRILTRNGRIDCRLPRYPDFPVMGRIGNYGWFDVLDGAVCPTRLRVAIVTQNHLAVWDCLDPPRSEGWNFVTTLHRMLRNKQFDRLDDLGAALQSDLEPFFWNGEFTKFRTFQNILQDYPGMLDEGLRGSGALNAWLEAKPDSRIARLLLANSLVREGWQHRGSGFAIKVTEEGWKKFHDLLHQAHEKLQPMLRDPEAPPEVFSILFEVAKAESWQANELQPYLERFWEARPGYFQPHLVMAEKLMPRWGGGERDSVNYADDVARRIGGDPGETLYARVAIHLLKYHSSSEFWDTTGFDYERVQRALLKRLEAAPQDSFSATNGLAMAFWRKDLARTKQFHDHLGRHKLAPAVTLFFDAGSYDAARRFATSEDPRRYENEDY